MAEMRLLECQWVSTVFPQYVPCYEIDGKMKVMIGRVDLEGTLNYLIPVYTSMTAKDRSSLWKGKQATTDPYFLKICNVRQAEDFWCNVLKMFLVSQNLTENQAHDLVIIFDHRNDRNPTPLPKCVFCYIIELRAEMNALGITKETESLKDVQVLGEEEAEEGPSIDLDES